MKAYIIAKFYLPRGLMSSLNIDGYYVKGLPTESGVYYINSFDPKKKVPFFSSCDAAIKDLDSGI